jgi:hypothetical protein
MPLLGANDFTQQRPQNKQSGKVRGKKCGAHKEQMRKRKQNEETIDVDINKLQRVRGLDTHYNTLHRTK